MAVSTVVGNEKVQPKVYTLNATHRCDSCGSQAYLQVTFLSGNDLLFCSHHYNRHEEAMFPFMKGAPVDERERLIENRKQGSEN